MRLAELSSPDGRTFTFDSSADGHAPGPGALLVVEPPDDGPLLVQVLDALGGLVVGDVTTGRPTDRLVRFHRSPARWATPEELQAVQAASGATLQIGTWTAGEVVLPARLRAQGFNRHTFLCGQSGSGKTYALGVVLERLLLETELRVVVLDPNADFTRLGVARPGATDATRIAEVAPRVLGSAEPGAEPVLARYATMPRHAQAALLRLDPLKDREEYNHFLHALTDETPDDDVDTLVDRLRAGGPAQQALAQRLENLRLLEWEVWARNRPSAAELVDGGSRATVLDLSGFEDPVEPQTVALDVIETLWRRRKERNPVLIVIDEAHNLCPAEPDGPVQKALVDRLVQIAAEGRKYGLWLLLSTQRPSKIHPQVLSQCDNLMLMRMNSPADVAELTEVFGFAPPAMIAAAPHFRQGEALFAGIFVPRPSLVRMGERQTLEGGSDVSVPVRSG